MWLHGNNWFGEHLYTMPFFFEIHQLLQLPDPTPCLQNHFKTSQWSSSYSKVFETIFDIFPGRVFPILEFLAPLQVFPKDFDANHRASMIKGKRVGGKGVILHG
jgi:hypothetical protein